MDEKSEAYKAFEKQSDAWTDTFCAWFLEALRQAEVDQKEFEGLVDRLNQARQARIRRDA